MKTLYLVRHASAHIDSPTKNDIDRPLNYIGLNEGELMAEYLMKSKVKIDLIMSSTAKRAGNTAEIFAKHFFYSFSKIERKKNIYSEKSEDVLNELTFCNDSTENILFVGHNPVITILANEFSIQPVASFKPAGIGCFTFEIESWKMLPVKGTLKFYMDPLLLKASSPL